CRPQPGRPARHAAALRREPGARRARAHRAERARGARQALAQNSKVRTLFLLLVLGNVAFFAWSRYVAPPEASADPLPLERQIEPEKLKVIAPRDLPPAAARPASAPTAAPPAPQVALRCVEWGSFTLADAPRAEKALEPLALHARLKDAARGIEGSELRECVQ